MRINKGLLLVTYFLLISTVFAASKSRIKKEFPIHEVRSSCDILQDTNHEHFILFKVPKHPGKFTGYVTSSGNYRLQFERDCVPSSNTNHYYDFVFQSVDITHE